MFDSVPREQRPINRRLVGLHQRRLASQPLWRFARALFAAAVLVGLVRTLSDRGAGLWASSATWLVYATAIAALTPIAAGHREELALRDVTRLRGLTFSELPLHPWVALWASLFRQFAVSGVLLILLCIWRAPIKPNLSMLLHAAPQLFGVFLALPVILTLLRALGQWLSAEHPRRLLFGALVIPIVLQSAIPELPNLTRSSTCAANAVGKGLGL